MRSVQIFLSPAAGKQLIADALSSRADILSAARQHTVVVIMGSTNAYLASALSKALGLPPFDPAGFFRGALKPADAKAAPSQKYDFILQEGRLLKEKTIFDVVGALGADDIIFKGANAVNLRMNTAGILIANPQGGTILPIEAAAVGRRTTLIHPVGVEKRVELPIQEIAALVNAKNEAGLRMFPATGSPYTELHAFSDLFGVKADIIAAGGVFGYAGGCLYRCEGPEDSIARLSAHAEKLRALY
ncbi:MAG: hypothetical protein ACTTK0_04890 [Stomatobaculum sp.]